MGCKVFCVVFVCGPGLSIVLSMCAGYVPPWSTTMGTPVSICASPWSAVMDTVESVCAFLWSTTMDIPVSPWGGTGIESPPFLGW